MRSGYGSSCWLVVISFAVVCGMDSQTMGQNAPPLQIPRGNGKGQVLIGNVALPALPLPNRQIPAPQFPNVQIPGVQVVRPDARAEPTLPRNRGLERQLHIATELYDEGEYSSAVRGFQAVLDALEDSSADGFAREREAGSSNELSYQLSLRTAVERGLAKLSPEARRIYHVQFGSHAKQLLDDGLKSNSQELIEQAARQYFYTPAGQKAARLLAQLDLDSGAEFRAANTLRRLCSARKDEADFAELSVLAAIAATRAGMPRDAADFLDALPAKKEIALFGKSYSVPELKSARQQWLRQFPGVKSVRTTVGSDWYQPGGNPQNNRHSSPFWAASKTVWEKSTASAAELNTDDEPQKALLSAAARRLTRQRTRDSLPAARPLIVDDLVIFRSWFNIQAMRLKDGQRVWESAASDSVLAEIFSPSSSALASSLPLLARRLYSDLTSQTLSSNGDHVFAVEQASLGGSVRGLTPTNSPDFNVLAAYDVKTGRALWQIGRRNKVDRVANANDGANEGANDRVNADPFALPAQDRALQPQSSIQSMGRKDFRGHYFLGPPLCLGDELYVLTEVGGQILLQCLQPKHNEYSDAWTVHRNWVVALANVSHNPQTAFVRREAGLMPACDGGVLYCPTNAGLLIAVDIARRTPQWAVPYGSGEQGATRLQAINGAMVRTMLSGGIQNWQDSSPRIRGRYLVMTPRDAAVAFCLDLRTGQALWTLPRDKRMFLGGVTSRYAVFVSQSKMEAFDIETGKLAWKSPFAKSAPAGMGGVTGGIYQQPMANGEVLSVDIASGRQLVSAGKVPYGNLVATGEHVVIQGPGRIAGWKNVRRVQEQLAESETNESTDVASAVAGRQLAIDFLRLGKAPQAIEQLEQTLAAFPDDQPSIQLFKSVLFEGLRTDYLKYESKVPRLTQLIHGNLTTAAITSDLELFTRDARLGSLRMAEATLVAIAGRAEMDRVQQMQMTAQLTSGDTKRAANLLLKMSQQPLAATALSQDHSVSTARWIRYGLQQLRERSQPAEWQSLLGRIEKLAADESAGGSELRRYDAIFRDLPVASVIRSRLIKSLDPKLDDIEVSALIRASSQQQARVKLGVHELQRGRFDPARRILSNSDRSKVLTALDQANLSEDDRQQLLSSSSSGLIDKSLAAVAVPGLTETGRLSPMFIPFESADEYFRGWSFYAVSDAIRAYDAAGQLRWEWKPDRDPRTGVAGSRSSSSRITNNGPLLLIERSGSIEVLNGYTPDENRRLLWRRARAGVGTFFNSQFPPVSSDGGKAMITDEYVAYRLNGSLVCADRLTGEEFWSRDDLSVDEIVSADAKFVCIKANGEHSLVVLDAIAGMDAGRASSRTLTSGTRRIRDGRMLYHLRSISKQTIRLAKVDPANQDKVVWQREFPAPAVISTVESHYIAIAAEDRSLQIVDLENGRICVHSNLNQVVPNRLSLFVQPDRFLVTLDAPAPNQQPFRTFTYSRFRHVFGEGPTMSFARSDGKKIWERNLTRHMVFLDHARHLPFLIVLKNAPANNRNTSIIGRTSTLEILDTRSGKTVFEQPRTGMLYGHVVPERQPGTIGILFSASFNLRNQNAKTIILGDRARLEERDDGVDLKGVVKPDPASEGELPESKK